MQPRLFLYDSQNSYTSKLLKSLSDLDEYYFDLSDEKYLLHVGFMPIAQQKVADAFDALPAAIYCTRSSKESGPPQQWQFTDASIRVDDNLVIYGVISAPLDDVELGGDGVFENLFSMSSQAVEISSVSTSRLDVPDVDLSTIEFSVRTTNVFERQNIRYLSQLVQLSPRTLMSYKNFGRKSLREIEQFWEGFGLELARNPGEAANDRFEFVPTDFDASPDPQLIVSEDFFQDIYDTVTDISDERDRDVVMHRCGISDDLTLQEISRYYNVTRERVRQLEARGLNSIFKKPDNKLTAWYAILVELVRNSTSPLKLSELSVIDPRFESAGLKLASILEYLINWVPRKCAGYDASVLQIVDWRGERYIALITEEQVKGFQELIVSNLQNSSNRPIEDIKNELSMMIPSDGLPFFEMVWMFELKHCLIAKRNEGDDILLKYVARSNIERAVYFAVDYLNASPVPLSREELRQAWTAEGIIISEHSVINVMRNHEDVFPYQHGLWATFKHITHTPHDVEILTQELERRLSGSNSVQVHSKTILDSVGHKISDGINEFCVSAILKKYTNFSYLGRNVFAAPDTELSSRLFIHDVLVNVLRANNKPMHFSDLVEEARALGGLGSIMQINERPPLKNLGRNVWALDYWDLDGESV